MSYWWCGQGTRKRTTSAASNNCWGKIFGATKKSPIPDLLQPGMLTFASDRGMMARGFEEIAGKRYCQGWWIRWLES
ncbi:hypothetical protein CVS48_22125 [Achromobacter spanius]|nr:hypothetical protein CVS48_22125 [Achromobacter spanius]